MLVKAIVADVINNHTARIRIPAFHKSASSSSGTPDADLPIAVICCPPGCTYALVQGDIVIVGFELNEMDAPIILGVLSKDEQKSSMDIIARALTVDVNCKLPEDTQYTDNIIQASINKENYDIENKKSNNVHTYGILVEENGKEQPNEDDTNLLNEYLTDPSTNPLTLWQMEAADINGDGEVNSTDYNLLCSYVQDHVVAGKNLLNRFEEQ